MLIRKLKRAHEFWQSRGWRGIKHRIKIWRKPRDWAADYQKWIELYDTLTDEDRRRMRERIADFTLTPKISILTPVYNVEEKWLRLCLESVLKQIYPHWELCIADDASTKPHVRRVLEEFSAADDRIKIIFRAQNGHISAASNTALEMATGEFCALLDHDDELSEHALFYVAEEINRYPEADLLYSDEDMIDAEGRRYDGKFKPDWSPDFFHEVNLLTHLPIYRTEILRRVGGFRLGYEGSQDYDLALRVTEQIPPQNIRHIPRILYHWRAIPGSVAFATSEKSYAQARSQRALQEHFERIGARATVAEGFQNYHYAQYSLPNVIAPRASLIFVSEKNDYLPAAIENLLKVTVYPNFEIVVICPSKIRAALEQKLAPAARVRIVEHNYWHNLAGLYNFAAGHALGEVLCFLDCSIRAAESEWLKELVRQARRPEIGAVGAKLLYRDGVVRHAGIILGVNGLCANAHEYWRADESGYYLRAQLAGNFSAVSGACLATRRDVFDSVKGFNGTDFPRGLFDVDFCLRVLSEQNLRVLFTPYAQLTQLQESASEKIYNSPRRRKKSIEVVNFKKRWAHLLDNDPYYNKNLSLAAGGDFSLAIPPRVDLIEDKNKPNLTN